MNNNNQNENDNFYDSFEDIEQMLKPQCEFKASDTLKEEVLRKAKDEVAPHRSINMWHWMAAACVVGVLTIFLMPPKTNNNVVEDTKVVAKVEQQVTKKTASLQTEETPMAEPVSETVVARKQSKATSLTATIVSQPTEETEPDDEPVQMSEETKMELLMAYLSPEEQMPMEIDHEEEIRKLRQRGEHLLSMSKSANEN